MKFSLSSYCSFANERVSVTNLDVDTYISTENMLPEKGGITRSAGLPSISQTQAYRVGDVLVSNIRPYFRKIWFSDRDGGCSNDVLVLRANSGTHPNFLYYLLSDNKFFDYATSTAKGTKMPRGDKNAIMQYEVPEVPFKAQIEIAKTLANLDNKIVVNKSLNHHLEQIAQAIFESWFVDFEPYGGEMPSDWREGMLGDICSYSRERVAVAELTTTTYISTESMQPNKAGCIEATSLPTITQTTAFKCGDVLISNIRPYFKKIVYCDFDGGCSTDVLCFRPNNGIQSIFLYSALYGDPFFKYMVAGSKGTKMPRGDKTQIMQYPITIPSSDALARFESAVQSSFLEIAANKNENIRLVALRDILLPKLMSGELSVSAAAVK